MAARKGPAAPARKKTRRSGAAPVWAFVAMMVPAFIFALPSALIFVVGMIPAMVAYAVDHDSDKTAPMIVGTLNFVGVLPFIMELWTHLNTLARAMEMMTNPATWLVMYGAAGLGWVFFHRIPVAVADYEVSRIEGKIERLRGRLKELRDEWGPEVAEEPGAESKSTGTEEATAAVGA